jgi:PAS domain S-box-containing protein
MSRPEIEVESLSPEVALSILGKLASAVFPGGVGDLSQLVWKSVTSPPSLAPSAARPIEEARLLAAELRYRTLVEQIPAVTFMAVLGEGKNEVYVSPHIETLLGYTQKDWLENPFLWYTQLYPADRPLWIEEFARGCRTGGPFRAECRFLARDGRIVWVRGEARLIKDELGRPLFLQGVAFDITDSKRAQEVLFQKVVRVTEERYRNLVERLGAIFWEADPSDGRFTFVSAGAERILGFPSARWLEDPAFWLSRIHPEDRDRIAALWNKSFTEGGNQEFEFRAITAEDQVVWLHQKLHFQGGGAEESRPFGVIIDITDRKRAEDELTRALSSEQTARTEAEALNRLGQSLAAELDLQQLEKQVAEVGAELTGAEWAGFWRMDDTRAARQVTWSSGTGAGGRTLDPSLDDPLLTPTFRGAAVLIDDLRLHPDQGLRSAIIRDLAPRSYLGVPVISRSGEVVGGLFFGHTAPGRFTERHRRLIEGFAAQSAIAVDNAQLLDAAESARTAAETANKAKDEFLATISHELRTPLNAVLGWTQVLQAVSPSDQTRERALAAIERNARGQAQIIEDLLDVSRIVSGKIHLDFTRVELAAVIDSVLEAVRPAAAEKEIRITENLDHSVAVQGDSHRLRQVVANLMTNALKFTSQGGRVDVGLDAADGMARIRVADNGRGIERAFLPHVFDRFRQEDSSSSRSHSGLGLGLAIVRHLAQLHGGTVRADSPGAGLGATFVVELPLDVPAVAPKAPDEGPRTAATAHGDLNPVLKHARILAVDDDPDSLEVLTHILGMTGAKVVSARSVAEAWRLLSRHHYDLLLCDLGMPHENGFDLIRRVRLSNGSKKKLPAAAVTAFAHDEDRRRALVAGFDSYLAKPIDASELLTVVSKLLGAEPAA